MWSCANPLHRARDWRSCRCRSASARAGHVAASSRSASHILISACRVTPRRFASVSSRAIIDFGRSKPMRTCRTLSSPTCFRSIIPSLYRRCILRKDAKTLSCPVLAPAGVKLLAIRLISSRTATVLSPSISTASLFASSRFCVNQSHSRRGRKRPVGAY